MLFRSQLGTEGREAHQIGEQHHTAGAAAAHLGPEGAGLAQDVAQQGGRDTLGQQIVQVVALAALAAPLAIGALLTWLTWRQVVVINVVPGMVMAVLILAMLGAFSVTKERDPNNINAKADEPWSAKKSARFS